MLNVYTEKRMIRKLSPELIEQIKSYSEINDLSESVIQLIYNSIDAKSKNIRVQIDLKSYDCIISDNGIGINETDLNLIGKRYFTSKFESIENLNLFKTFGYHGESICNLVELSDCLDLFTRIGTSNQFWHKRLQTNDESLGKCKCLNYENFTTVFKLKNLSGKHCLRQNQLKQNEMKMLKNLLKLIENLSIIHYDIEIIVDDFNSILFQTVRCNSLKHKFISLFNSNNQEFIKDFSLKDENYEIYGLISEITKTSEIFTSFNFQSSRIQFIYVNLRHIENKNIYDFVAKKLSNCHPLNLLKSDFKQIIYCLSIKCKNSNDFIFTRLNQNILIEFKNERIFFQSLENFIDQFLIYYGFKKTINLPHENEAIEPVLRETNDFEFNNVKSSKKIRNNYFQNEKITTNNNKVRLDGEPKAKKIDLLRIVPVLNRKKLLLNELKSKFRRKNTNKLKNKSTQTESNINIKLKPNWNKLTNSLGVDFYFNEIDGNTTYDVNLVKSEDDFFANNSLNYLNKNNFLDYNHTVTLKEFDLNKALMEKLILVKWRNKDEFMLNEHARFENNFIKIETLKLDHSLFEQIKIVGQLDRKFIIGYKKQEKKYSLFIFDQHAVHERIRLEDLYKGHIDVKNNCIQSEALKEPLKIVIKPITDTNFKIFEARLKKIGFSLTISKSDSTESLILVHKVPKILLKKSNHPNSFFFFNNFIQSQLNKPNLDYLSKKSEFSLLDVPSELLNAFNLEACRGAIKFGDSLDNKTCESMISCLSTKTYPFYCAHGRPSVMPITNIFDKKENRVKLNLKKLMSCC